MTIRFSRTLPALCCALVLISSLSADTPPRAKLGFFPASVVSQDAAEAAFLAVPTPKKAEEWSRQLTEEPHVAGTPADHALAEMVRDRLKEYGFDTSIVTYQVLLNYPKHVALKMVEPSAQELALVEPGYPRDKDSYSADAFPAFHGYGASGHTS